MIRKRRFENLLQPFQIGPVKLRNRMVKLSQNMLYGDPGGYAGDRTRAFYEELAKGGVGLIIVESTGVYWPAGLPENQKGPLYIYDDKFIPKLSELVRALHQHGCPAFLQLNHLGPQSYRIPGFQTIGASPLRTEENPVPEYGPVRGLSTAEIGEVIDRFSRGVERARRAGFDGVEIHGGHSYLINSFLSRAWNKREDEYGYGSPESRARLAGQIIEASKKRAGSDFPVGIRINGGEWGIEKGTTPEEAQVFAPLLQKAGADYLNITGYGYGNSSLRLLLCPEQILYPEPDEAARPLAKKIKKPGAFVPLAEAIKKVVSIPVVAVGRLDPVLGESILRERKADLIGLGRRLLVDPELPQKVGSGRLDEIRPCTACLNCLDCFRKGEPVQCRVNATLGRESEYRIKAAEKRKRIIVIGGGPAGMEAARIAGSRGHQITLLDKNQILGGLIPVASLVKGTEVEDLLSLISYFKRQFQKLGIEVRLGKTVDLSMIENMRPDAVIIATGGKSALPQIPGIHRSQVKSAQDMYARVATPLRFFGPRLLRWLTRCWMPLRKTVLILGGGIQGCELAEFLVKRGRKVTIVATGNELGSEMTEYNRQNLLMWLEKKGVTLLTEVRFEEIVEEGLIVTTRDGTRKTIRANSILPALPLKENSEFFKSLNGKVSEIHIIGDSREPHLIKEAIADGARVGRIV